MLIAPPLFRFSATYRNYTDNFCAVLFIPDGMGHQKQQIAINKSQGLPAALLILDTVLLN
ncbi:hypothetical protein CARN8_3090001 [mine drainage metagenome]|uniref:Uncharacterized protein n=1 Tax=mine drainage metagenome TaxID=410659 RepID=A0A3P3ZNQ9_9ZZZZ